MHQGPRTLGGTGRRGTPPLSSRKSDAAEVRSDTVVGYIGRPAGGTAGAPAAGVR